MLQRLATLSSAVSSWIIALPARWTSARPIVAVVRSVICARRELLLVANLFDQAREHSTRNVRQRLDRTSRVDFGCGDCWIQVLCHNRLLIKPEKRQRSA